MEISIWVTNPAATANQSTKSPGAADESDGRGVQGAAAVWGGVAAVAEEGAAAVAEEGARRWDAPTALGGGGRGAGR
jgi:hypothetical protein